MLALKEIRKELFRKGLAQKLPIVQGTWAGRATVGLAGGCGELGDGLPLLPPGARDKVPHSALLSVLVLRFAIRSQVLQLVIIDEVDHDLPLLRSPGCGNHGIAMTGETFNAVPSAADSAGLRRRQTR